MRVYAKRDSFGKTRFGSLLGWLAMTFMALISVILLVTSFMGEFVVEDLVVAIVFTLIVMVPYGFMIFKPTKRDMRLISKTIETYKGENITNMKFAWMAREIDCYTIGDNALEVDKKYLVITSRFDGLPIRVENN